MDHVGLQNAMADALRSYSLGAAKNYPRHVIQHAKHQALGYMAGSDPEEGLLGFKTVSVFAENKFSGLNPHQGTVTLLDSATGMVRTILEGSTLTAIRTAAVSAVATNILATSSSETLALIGVGRQAFEHALALTRVRQFERILIFSRSSDSMESLARVLRDSLSLGVIKAKSPLDAIAQADVIVTCTSSPEPLIDVKDIPEGAHVNAVGACRPGYREINIHDSSNLSIFLDSRAACSVEASEISLPLLNATLSESTIMGEIGECLAGRISGRRNGREITVFKSVGLGIEDIFAANYIDKVARHKGVGTLVDLKGL